MFRLIQAIGKMKTVNLNNKTKTGLNTHSFSAGKVSHNKILSVNENDSVSTITFFCSFPDKIL